MSSARLTGRITKTASNKGGKAAKKKSAGKQLFGQLLVVMAWLRLFRQPVQLPPYAGRKWYLVVL